MKKKNYDYEKVVQLKHHEIPAKIDLDTGEITSLYKPNNLPQDREQFLANEKFDKHYWASHYVWDWLETTLTDLELRVTHKLVRVAKMNTNSLEPLNDDILLADLCKEFNIGKNKVGPMFKKLHTLGIYGKFDVVKESKPYTKYWILNPFLAFSGKFIEIGISSMFIGTTIHKIFVQGQDKVNRSTLKKSTFKYLIPDERE